MREYSLTHGHLGRFAHHRLRLEGLLGVRARRVPLPRGGRQDRAIDWVRTDGLVTEFRFRPTLPGLPGAPQTVSRMTLTPGRRIDIAYAPSPANRIVRHLSSFRACFECEPDGERTRVTRSLSLGLPRFLRAVEVPLLRSLLQRSIDRELDLASRRSWPPPPARAVHRDRW